MPIPPQRRLNKLHRVHREIRRLSVSLGNIIHLVNDLIDVEEEGLGIADENDRPDFQIGNVVKPFSGAYRDIVGVIINKTTFRDQLV